MEINEVVSIISQLGFPVFVAVWFMFRDQKTVAVIEANTRAMQSISDKISACPYRDKNGKTN